MVDCRLGLSRPASIVLVLTRVLRGLRNAHRAQQARAVSSSLNTLANELNATTTTHQLQARAAVDTNLDNKIRKNQGLVNDLTAWIEKVDAAIALMVTQEEEVTAFRDHQQRNLEWCTKMQDFRSVNRPVRERTDDTTQFAFAKLANVINSNINSLQKLIQGCKADNIHLVDARRKLDRDLQVKSHALGLDKGAVESNESHMPTPFYAPPSTVGIPLTMGAWVKQTQDVIEEADRCMHNADRMRHLTKLRMEEHLALEHKTVKFLRVELRKNVVATEGLIAILNVNIAETVQKQESVEATAAEVEMGLNKKYPSMDLAKHRYTHRTYEGRDSGTAQAGSIGDHVHQSLRDEYAYLDMASQQLIEQLKQLNIDAAYLQSATFQLKDDLTDKEAHLAVDTHTEQSTSETYPMIK